VIIQHETSHEQMKSRTLVPSATRTLVCLLVLALPMPMLMRPSMLAFTAAPPRAATATTLATRLHSVSSLGIVGGGLAGLSTAFHILDKTQGACHVTIYDKSPVGTGGASSVAGGYVPCMLHYCMVAFVSEDYNIFATLDRAWLMTTVYITKISETKNHARSVS
jgi:hypothetical protein